MQIQAVASPMGHCCVERSQGQGAADLPVREMAARPTPPRPWFQSDRTAAWALDATANRKISCTPMMSTLNATVATQPLQWAKDPSAYMTMTGVKGTIDDGA